MKLIAAGLVVETEVRYDLLRSRAEPYLYDGTHKADITIKLSDRFFDDRGREHPNLTPAECEYLWTASYYYSELTRFDGLMLHASAVEYQNKAYLFSARSGTGKSTHTHLWLKYLKGARIINDDKPALRLVNGTFFAFGTPWSGKTDESVNTGVPFGGIALLSRGENKIERCAPLTALSSILDQTVRPIEKPLMTQMLSTLDRLLREVPVYRFSCDVSEEAVRTAVQGMVH